MIYPLSATSQSIDVQIVDDTGLPVTGLVAATFPTLTYSLAGANADVAFPALSDLAAITTAYSSGGVKERGNGVYRLDLPNGVFTTAGEVKIRGEATGKHVLAPWIDVAVTVANLTNAPPDSSGVGTLLTRISGNITIAAGKVAATMGSADYSGNTVQTGDAYARLGAPAGVSVSADVAAVKSDTATILNDVNVGAGAIYTRLGAPAGASIAADVAAVKSSVGTPQQSGTKYAVTLLSTDVSGNLPADLQTIKGQTVTCAAGVTVGAFVGNATHAILVDASGRVEALDSTGAAFTYTTPPTAAQIATAIFTDTTGTDFTTANSPGKVLMAQLAGTFTTNSSSVFNVAALANAPTGGGGGGPVQANIVQVNSVPVGGAGTSSSPWGPA